MKTGIFSARLAVIPMAVAVAFFSTSGVAQTADGSTALQQVVVTAMRVEQPLADVLSSLTVISRKDIERSQAQSLADLLQGEAGFEFGRNGGPGAVTSFFLRGQDSINTVMLIDGIRAPVDQIGSLLVIDIPIQQIERIEILRGNASALYGDAAVGGVISITTRSGVGVPKAYGSGTLGARNTRELLLGYAGESDGYQLNFNLGSATSDGFSAMNSQQRTAANPDNDPYKNAFAALRLDKKVAPDLAWGLRVKASVASSDYDDQYGAPTDVDVLKKYAQNVGAYVRRTLTDDWTSTLDVSLSQLRYEDSKNGVLFAAGDYSYKNGLSSGNQRAVRWSNTYQTAADTLLNFGLDSSQASYTGEGDNAYDMRKTSLGYYAGVTQSLGKVTLQGNLRNDHLVTENTASGTTGRSDQSATSGLLGLGYRIDALWKLTGSVSTGFRAPTAYEVAATPTVKPEFHHSQEVGVSYADGTTYARAVYFETRTDDAITSDDGWPETYSNIGRTQNKGIEATLQTQWWGNRVRFSVVSQDPKSLSTGLALARRARNYGSIDVSRMVAGCELGAKVYGADQRNNSAYDSVVLAGYSLWSFYASKAIDSEWTVRARVDNAFDRQYQLAYGYNTPGAGAFVTLQYQPK
ncbi:MAG: TonB-dependent receptor [Betaproteobacteria bacterium]